MPTTQSRHVILAWALMLPIVVPLYPDEPIAFFFVHVFGTCILAALIAHRWELLARVLAWPPVVRRVIAYGKRQESFHIHNGLDLYMERWYLFNRDPRKGPRQYPWLPFAIRLHHIVRADNDRHLHNHEFSFRTVILQGYYMERTEGQWCTNLFLAGQTRQVDPDSFYHRIVDVSQGGVWTLVIVGRRGTQPWGFKVDGKHVAWNEYLGDDQ